MLLAERKELEELRKLAGRSEKQISNERLVELEEEASLDKKEAGKYLSETLTEEALEDMPWLERLSWVITGLSADLADVELQTILTTMKDTPAAKEIEGLRQRKLKIEKRKLDREEQAVKAQEASGILPPGSLEELKERREKAEEYSFKPSSLQKDTKFAKLTKEQLIQKKKYLTYRAKERSEELEELQTVTQTRQKENAKKVLERIGGSGEYPT